VEAPVSKDKLEKTNAARILDGLGVPYELRAYAVDEDDLSAESVARMSATSWRWKGGSGPALPARGPALVPLTTVARPATSRGAEGRVGSGFAGPGTRPGSAQARSG
jgi:hypothetical protein